MSVKTIPNESTHCDCESTIDTDSIEIWLLQKLGYKYASTSNYTLRGKNRIHFMCLSFGFAIQQSTLHWENAVDLLKMYRVISEER